MLQTIVQFLVGKVIVFCGDLRQILPIIARGSCFYIVHSTINASHLWDHCQVLALTKNMCLLNNLDNTFASELNQFA